MPSKTAASIVISILSLLPFAAYAVQKSDCTQFIPPKSRNIAALTFGKGNYVTVGDFGTILASKDLKEWSVACTNSTGEKLISVAFSGERFVAVGQKGTILFSDDGFDWKLVDTGTKHRLNFITFAGDQFLIAGDSGTILVSPDGKTWNQKNRTTKDNHLCIAYGNQTYVVSDNTHHLFTSTDCLTWQTWKLGGHDYVSVTYGNGMFLAVGGNESVISTDGKKWSSAGISVETTTGLASATFGNDTFMVIMDDTHKSCFSSTDGTTWHLGTLPLFPNTVHFCNNRFITTSSNDGIAMLNNSSWTIMSTGSGWVTDVCFGNDLFVAVGERSTEVLYSKEGINWSAAPSPGVLTCITFGNNRFVAAGVKGCLFISTDAINWKPQVSGTARRLFKALWGNDEFVILGDSCAIVSSPNGETWTYSNNDSLGNPSSIAYGNGRYVVAGLNIYTSTDLTVWNRFNRPPNGIDNLSYVNNRFLGFNRFGMILSSDSGWGWATHYREPDISNFNCALFVDGIYFVGGTQGGFICSPDLNTWNFMSLKCTDSRYSGDTRAPLSAKITDS